MSISVVDPVNSAIERARKVCFRPFDLGKWFTIGFCALLAGFVEGGGGVNLGGNFNFPTSPSGPAGPGGPGRPGVPGGKPATDDIRQAIDWIGTHLLPIVAIGLLVLIALIAIGAVFTWLGSRGQFMFIDNIVQNRAAVVAPWHEYRKEGNSLFWFRFLFGLVMFVAFLAVLTGGIVPALPDIRAVKFGSAALAGLVVLIVGFIILGFFSALVTLFLNDFVVPIMFLRRIGVMAAWREFRTSLLAGRAGTFVLYVFFKIVLSIIFGLLMSMVMCCTLCIAAIPYVGSHVLLLPMHVFYRSYSLFFLEQFGPEWQIFTTADVVTAELVDDDAEGFHPGEEHYRPDDFDNPPDDRIRPQ